MYLHLGQNVVVPEADVIGIFDLDNTTGSRITRGFLNDAEKNGRVVSVSDELPRSFVVCDERGSLKQTSNAISGRDGNNGMMIYLSQLSTQTLLKRSGTIPN